jgi:hypothetical protein
MLDGTTPKLQTDRTRLSYISMVTIVTSFFMPDSTNIKADDRSLELNLSSVGDLEDSPFMLNGTTFKPPTDRWSSIYAS